MLFNKKYNVLVTGAKGQLGSYLVDRLQKLAFKSKSKVGQVFGIDIDDLDLTDVSAVADFFNFNVIDPPLKIDYVIHCAAATNTAAIERDPLKYYASTVIGTKNVAESCAYNGIKMIHISTDYVLSELSPMGFCGKKIEFPVNQYGMHKLLAEKEAQLAYCQIGHPERLLIGRLSWLFGNSHSSFIEKLLNGICNTYAKAVKSGKKAEHKVVDDAFGKPTPVSLVLDKVLEAVDEKQSGVVDFQYDGAQISRLDWAQCIWGSFCNMLNEAFDNAIFYPLVSNKEVHDTLVDMMHCISLVGVKSDTLDLGMRHPGLVTTSSNGVKCSFTQCTNEYIRSNFTRLLCDVVYEKLKEEGLT